MIIFRVIPVPSLDDLSGNLRPMGVEVFPLHLFSHPLGDVSLRWRVVEDGRAVLSPTVVSLPIESRRVMCAVEEFNELSIGYYVRVKLDPQRFSVVRGTRTNSSVARIVDVSPGIPDSGLEDPLVLGRRVVLQEYMFDSPEASSCECGDFGSDLSWGRHRVWCAIERC